MPYTGDGFALLVPSKYNPSKEVDFKGVKVTLPSRCFVLFLLSFPSFLCRVCARGQSMKAGPVQERTVLPPHRTHTHADCISTYTSEALHQSCTTDKQTRVLWLQVRYEDNGDAVNNFVVIKVPSSKGSIESYGSPDAFLQEIQSYGLLGKQAYTGALPGVHSMSHSGRPLNALLMFPCAATLPKYACCPVTFGYARDCLCWCCKWSLY